MNTNTRNASIYNNLESFDPSRIRLINSRKKRERQLHRRITIFVVMTSVILFLGIFLSFSFLSDAKGTGTNKDRYFTTVTITAGDTLWSIAEEHMDPHYNSVAALVGDIAKINRIPVDSKLTPGGNLFVPYFKDKVDFN